MNNKTSKRSFDILDEIINVLTTNTNYDRDCVSLYDVSQIIRKKYNEYYCYEEEFCDRLDKIIKLNFGFKCSLIMYDFDYINNELRMGFKSDNKYEKIIFSKENKKIFIKESYTTNDYNILDLIGNYLSDFYDICLKYRDFYTQGVYGIKPVNSKFSVSLSSSMVKISLNDNFVGIGEKEFELIYRSYINSYSCECGVDNIIGSFNVKENEIFKNIYIKIDDCPRWSQNMLSDFRNEQIHNDNNENVKSKKISFRNKILTLLKK